MIIVTGATGHLGRAIVERLVVSSNARASGGDPLADGKVSWTAHADLAEAAAIILADEEDYGSTPPLTGS